MPGRDDYVGKVVVVGIAHVAADGSRRAEQYAGTIDRFLDQDGEEAMVLLCHDAVERAFPWDAEALEPVEPGLYRLNDGGATIRDPDYVMQFAVRDGDTEDSE